MSEIDRIKALEKSLDQLIVDYSNLQDRVTNLESILFNENDEFDHDEYGGNTPIPYVIGENRDWTSI